MDTSGFRWNFHADQPHNVASRSARRRAHFKYAESYLRMIRINLQGLTPILVRYKRYRKSLYTKPVIFEDPFAVSVSLLGKKENRILSALKEMGINHTLLRIPSWEDSRLIEFEAFVDLLRSQRLDVVIALIQSREDVLNNKEWTRFLDRVFSRFSDKNLFFEIGHAWNRTKWGVWDYKEYLRLAEAAASIAKKYEVRLLGPSVIDFEFHLYPPVLKVLDFNKITSLLYVDRVGAPEKTQFGWDLSRKIALLKAVIDQSSRKGKELWITEFNWPLKGTGKYSPASGKPNVTEEQQANFLVRYYILALSTGLVKRIYWWQLVAPGYGLIDNRRSQWRKRPSFWAFKVLKERLNNSVFVKKEANTEAEIFIFRKNNTKFAVCWTRKGNLFYSFSDQVMEVLNRDGLKVNFSKRGIVLTEKPVYVYFEAEK
jgi:hypothetical protein